MPRNRATVLLVLAFAMMLLAACSGAEETSPAPVEDQATSTTAEENTGAEAGTDGENSSRQGAASADAAAEQILRAWIGGDRAAVAAASFDAVPGALFDAEQPSVAYVLPCENDPANDAGKQCQATTGSESLVVLKVAPDGPNDGSWLVTEASVQAGAGWTDADPNAKTIQ